MSTVMWDGLVAEGEVWTVALRNHAESQQVSTGGGLVRTRKIFTWT
ncbi:uncharacterized protein CMC5_071710 [Chondromyces crocatus]|uniref:Uncharacterized protein n=1 Tax=Chondromyces crocatus TaxID=52 RepID=A0A0K1EQP0_CHOCO|nr:uncharacterized protein CMC5_071710 [Chondromyces crocatus]